MSNLAIHEMSGLCRFVMAVLLFYNLFEKKNNNKKVRKYLTNLLKKKSFERIITVKREHLTNNVKILFQS